MKPRRGVAPRREGTAVVIEGEETKGSGLRIAPRGIRVAPKGRYFVTEQTMRLAFLKPLLERSPRHRVRLGRVPRRVGSYRTTG